MGRKGRIRQHSRSRVRRGARQNRPQEAEAVREFTNTETGEVNITGDRTAQAKRREADPAWEETGGAPAIPEMPNRSDNKPEWVAYALAVDASLTEEEAEETTKAALIERYG